MHNIRSIIDQFGKPNFLINAKCNVQWPEIVRELSPRQPAAHRPDILVKALKNRLEVLIERLRNRVYFGGNMVEYIFYWIEYPYGNVPSVGVAVKFNNTHLTTIEASINFVDVYIKAENPSQYDTHDDFIDMPVAQYKTYRTLVNKFMIYQCTQVEDKPDIKNICKMGLNPNGKVPATFIDSNGIMIYRRRKLSDMYVIPHNPQMLLDWDGFLNVVFIPKDIDLYFMYKILSKSEVKPVVFIH